MHKTYLEIYKTTKIGSSSSFLNTISFSNYPILNKVNKIQAVQVCINYNSMITDIVPSFSGSLNKKTQELFHISLYNFINKRISTVTEFWISKAALYNGQFKTISVTTYPVASSLGIWKGVRVPFTLHVKLDPNV